LDSFLVTDLLNVRYLTGFVGTFAVLLVTEKDVLLLTDSRYTQQAAEQCPDCTIRQVEQSWIPCIHSLEKELHLDRIGFEDHSLSYKDWSELRAGLSDAELVPARNLVEELRRVKDDREVEAIRRAARVADAALEYIVSILKPGLRERDIVLELDYFIRRAGAEKEAFDSIVLSGQRTALPHGKPTSRVVSQGELLLLDFGARWEGYHSDITRTFVLGAADEEQRKIYKIVLEAQSKAIDAIRPGILGREVDAVARDYIDKCGYGQYFVHGLGHDLGLAVHDGRALSKYSDTVLQPGMVVTVEPAVYIPGWGGIRIEDDVLVTTSSCEVLTHAPKRLELNP
jgi:Xaa-Pro aminopeptidase